MPYVHGTAVECVCTAIRLVGLFCLYTRTLLPLYWVSVDIQV